MNTILMLKWAPDFFKKEDLENFFQSEEFQNYGPYQLNEFVMLILKGTLDNPSAGSTIRKLLIQIFGEKLTGLGELILNHPSAYKAVEQKAPYKAIEQNVDKKNNAEKSNVLQKDIRALLMKNVKSPIVQTLLMEDELAFTNTFLDGLGHMKFGVALNYAKLYRDEQLPKEDIQKIAQVLTESIDGVNKERLFFILSNKVKEQVLLQMSSKQLNTLFDSYFFVKFLASDEGAKILTFLEKDPKALHQLMMRSRALIRIALLNNFSWEVINNLARIFDRKRVNRELKRLFRDNYWIEQVLKSNSVDWHTSEKNHSNSLFMAYLLKHNVSKFQFVMNSIRLEIKDIINASWLIDYLNSSVEKLFKMAEGGQLRDYELDSLIEHVLSLQSLESYHSRAEKLMYEHGERLLLSSKNNAILTATSHEYFRLLHQIIKDWDAQKLAKVLNSKTLEIPKIVDVLRKMKFSDAYKMRVLKLM